MFKQISEKIISIISIIIFLFAASKLAAQPDNIQNEILNYENTNQLDIINKSRRMLLDKFEEGDIQKVKEIKNYLLNYNSFENYMTLYFGERFCILFWTREYTELLRQIRIWDSINNIQIEPKNRAEMIYGIWARFIHPTQDFLLEKLLKKTKDSADYLRNELNRAVLTQQEKDLLNMLFIRWSNEYSDKLQDSLNLLADEYIQNYPGDLSLPYVRKILRVKYYEVKDWSFSFGGGYGKLTKSMAENYKDMGVFSIDLKFYSGRSSYLLNFLVGMYSNKKEMVEDGIYLPINFSHSVPNVSLGYGYDVINAKYFSLYPTLKIGYMWAGPDSTKDADWYSDFKVFKRNSIFYSPGINAELRIPTSMPDYWTFNPNRVIYILLSFNYNYIMKPNNDRFLSNVHHFGISIGFLGIRKVRDM